MAAVMTVGRMEIAAWAGWEKVAMWKMGQRKTILPGASRVKSSPTGFAVYIAVVSAK
jgi:hypothetical protein